MKKAIDVNDLEAQFLTASKAKSPIKKGPAFIVGAEEGDEFDDVIDFNDAAEQEEVAVIIPNNNNYNNNYNKKQGAFSYAAATNNNTVSTVNTNSTLGSSPVTAMTVEELEAQLLGGMVVSPKSPVSQLVGAGPPPGLPPGLSNTSNNTENVANKVQSSLGFITSSTGSNTTNMMSSTAPLPKNDPNREFMNRFERNLIMKIHTTQLTTETPLMDDFYYQALTKKKATMSEGPGPLLYFPLPSAADRQKELQRRERRRKQREREREKEKEKEKEVTSTAGTSVKEDEINADLVLGKVSHSSYRKPRQQLQIPVELKADGSNSNADSSLLPLHEKVMKGIEAVYAALLAVEDFYLLKEESAVNDDGACNSSSPDDLIKEANVIICQEMNLKSDSQPNHEFIHFLTIPKGRRAISRILKLLNDEGREAFLSILIEHFDFLEIVRPETDLIIVDAFISQVLSPLVAFVGEADWQIVMNGLRGLFAKRSFVWIALTKAGTVLLCILLSRLEILKASVGSESSVVDEAAALTEKIFDSLEGHLLEFFSSSDPSRDFYAWQCLALLAMNVESDRKRAMILELRDKILIVVEAGEERAVKNLNVFLNALGLDASQLK